MAKSISIDTSHVYTSRGAEMSVKDALAWMASHMTGEDEDGNETGPAYSPADLIVYGVRRLMALHKDGKRFASGKLASRLYAPRLDNVEHAPKGLAPAVESIEAIGARLNPKPEPKAAKPRKAPKAAKVAKPSKLDTLHAMAEVTARKQAARKSAKPPKASKAPKGGAEIAF